MATEFGARVTDTPELRSAVTPQQGVAERPVLLEGISNLFEQAGGLLEERKEKKKKTALSEFTRRQLLVADALDQGRINSSAHARTLMRKNLLDAIEMNPALANDYITAQASIVGLPGGADIVKEGDQEEQDARARRSSLIQAGALSYDADDRTFQQVDSNMRMAEEATRQHTLRMQTLDEELKTGQVTTARRAQIEQERTAASVDLMRQTSGAEYQMVKGKMDEILKSDMPEAEKQMALDDLWSGWNSEISNRLGTVGEREGGAYMKPFQMLYESYSKRVTGELTDAELERSNKSIIELNKSIALLDPEIARLSVTSDLFGESGLTQVLAQSPAVFRSYAEFLAGTNSQNRKGPANPFVKDAADRQGMRAGLDTITSGLKSDNPEVRQQATEAMATTLQSFEDYEAMLRRDPSAGIEVINWMGSAQFLEARRNNPELFENSPILRDVFERHYDDQVWGMVQNEFINAQVAVVPDGFLAGLAAASPFGNGTEQQPVNGNVGVRSNASGVEFFAIDPDNKQFVEEARRLNRELKPVINNTLKAGAHLEGRTDYQNVWQEVATRFTGADAQAAQSVDIEISDFAERVEAAESTGAPVGSVVDAGRGYTVVRAADGTAERRVGTRAWRNNNPGNIEYGEFARSQGAVGSDGRFAVFPSYEAGREAKAALIFDSPSYRTKSIAAAIARYAPAFENDTASYARQVAAAAGVTVNTPMSSLNPDQRRRVLDAMERVEGFKVGTTERIE